MNKNSFNPSSFKEEVFWQTTLSPHSRPWSNAEISSIKQDVVIVGGGITGLSAALFLARYGLSVTILESQTMGWGASSRNGGQVLTGLKQSPSLLIKKFGLNRARELYQASLDSIDVIEEIVQQEKIDCDYVRSGHFNAAFKPKHLEELKQKQAILSQQFGHHTRLVPPHEMPSELNTHYYCGGLVDEKSASINPAKFIRGLALSAERNGAKLIEKCTVTAVRRNKEGFTIETSKGTLATNDVFAATNSYTNSVFPYLQRRIVPLGSYIIATEPLPASLAQNLIPNRRMVFDNRYFLYYFRLSPDNRIIFGGRAAFFPETPTTVQESARILQQGMIKVFPQLSNLPLAYAWGGLVDMTFDLFPHKISTFPVYH